MTQIFATILLLASIVCSVSAWGLHPSDRSSTSRLYASAESRESSMLIQRRDLLLAASGIVLGTSFLPDAARASDDPFAQMDAIAEKIKESSNYPNSISPLPTYKATEKELVSDGDDAPPKSDKKTSDMDKALGDMQKKKGIDPMTHG
jgi:hypothetical protein